MRLNQNKNHFLSKVAAGIEKNVAYWFGSNGARVSKVSAQFNPTCESSVIRTVISTITGKFKERKNNARLLEIEGVKAKRLTRNNTIFNMSSNPRWFGRSSVLYEAKLASTRQFRFHSV